MHKGIGGQSTLQQAFKDVTFLANRQGVAFRVRAEDGKTHIVLKKPFTVSGEPFDAGLGAGLKRCNNGRQDGGQVGDGHDKLS